MEREPNPRDDAVELRGTTVKRTPAASRVKVITESGSDDGVAEVSAAAASAATVRDVAQSPERLRPLLQILGSVLAPTTLLTALFFYFGWAHAYWFFSYFGFDISLMGLTTQDYLMRSVDALFVPLTLSLGIGLLLSWLHAWLAARLFAGPNARARRRVAVFAAAAFGLLLFLTGMAGFLVKDLRNSYLYIYPLSLGAGTLLLSYASRLHRRYENSGVRSGSLQLHPLIEAAGAFLLVAVSLFWASTNYAAAVGETRAVQYEGEFRSYPEAFLYSTEKLHLDAPGVEEVSCDEPGGGYRFRYQGLRLMLRSGGHYFLLPETWSRAGGVSIVVPESQSVRLQFMQNSAGLRQSGQPAAVC